MLLSVELSEFCQFKHHKLLFGNPGVFCLTGRNGAGKSNTINAIFGCLTDEWRNDGTKDCDARIGRDGDTFVEIQLDLGEICTIRRGLAPSSHFLRVGTDKPIDRARAIGDKLKNLLGVSPWLLSELAFVPQGHTAEFLSRTFSERVASFQKLFGIDSVKAAHSAVTESLSKLRDVYFDETKWAEAENDLKVCLERCGELRDSAKSFETSLRDKRPLQQLVDQHRARQRLSSALALSKSDYERMLTEVLRVERNLARASEDRNVLVYAEQATREDYERSLALLKSYDESRVLRAKLDSVNTTLSDWARRVERLRKWISEAEAALPSSGFDVSDIHARITELQRQKHELKVRLDLADECENGRCPVCHSVVDSVAGIDIEAEEARYAELSKELYALNDYQFRRRTIDDKITELNHELASMERFKTQNAEILSAEIQEFTPEELLRCRHIKKSHEETVEALRESTTAHDALERQLRELNALTQDAPYRALEEQLNQLPAVDEHEVDEAARKLIWLREIEMKLHTTNALLKEMMDRERQLLANLESLKKVRAEIERKGRWRGRLTSLAEKLSYDSIPTLWTRRKLDAVEPATNDVLAAFEAPFEISIHDDLRFWIHKTNGIAHSDARLSDAEKLILALSFRIAVAKEMAGRLKLICLDEPTYGMDEHNLRKFCEIIPNMRTFCKSVGMQMIIVTHEKTLADCCDSVYDLGSGVS